MAYQSIFKRHEIKYMLTQQQKECILDAMRQYMTLDDYGHSTIRNIYFDTPSYRLIRHSIDKPAYKEKLRIRSYEQAGPDTPVFIELKKKFKSVVYKRRISMSEKQAMDWLCGDPYDIPDTQIAREIDYFLEYYQTLQPSVFLSYERDAYRALDGSDLRITFDNNILCRESDLSLCSEIWGTPLLEYGKTLMEIKTSGGIPMWLSHLLSHEHIFKTSFSKYGVAYQSVLRHHMPAIHCSRT